MEKAILPISYFGPIEYYQLLNRPGSRIERHETYQKRSIRNKMNVLGANGPLSLSVPLQKGKTRLPIEEVKIAYEEAWVDLHIKTLTSAYRSAPYFDFYSDRIFSLLSANSKTLFALCESINRFLLDRGIINEVNYTEEFVKVYSQEFRDLGPETRSYLNA